MRILVAPDKFKGSLTAKEAAACIAEGFRRVVPTAYIVEIPMADGGEGTVQSLVDATHGRLVRVSVTGPLGDPVEAQFGLLGDGSTAVIEMAAASGLALVPTERRNPRLTTTRGTGELVLAALDHGCRRVIIGIGGSATNDGGAGMAQALGVRLLDAQRRDLPPGGAALASLAYIDMTNIDVRIASVDVIVACDVTNPLCGDNGASAVYGPQKGATPAMVGELDAALKHYASVIEGQLGKDVAETPGAGAAGGLGAGLLTFMSARLQSGVEIVMGVVGLEAAVCECDLVVTGEGGIDAQTAFGKAPAGVAQVAVRHGKPVVALAGSVADGVESLHQHGFDAIFSLVRRPMSLAEAVQRAPQLLTDASEEVARLCKLGAGFSKADFR